MGPIFLHPHGDRFPLILFLVPLPLCKQLYPERLIFGPPLPLGLRLVFPSFLEIFSFLLSGAWSVGFFEVFFPVVFSLDCQLPCHEQWDVLIRNPFRSQDNSWFWLNLNNMFLASFLSVKFSYTPLCLPDGTAGNQCFVFFSSWGHSFRLPWGTLFYFLSDQLKLTPSLFKLKPGACVFQVSTKSPVLYPPLLRNTRGFLPHLLVLQVLVEFSSPLWTAPMGGFLSLFSRSTAFRGAPLSSSPLCEFRAKFLQPTLFFYKVRRGCEPLSPVNVF